MKWTSSTTRETHRTLCSIVGSHTSSVRSYLAAGLASSSWTGFIMRDDTPDAVIMRVTRIGLTLVGLLFVLAQSVQPVPTQARAAAEPVPWHPCARIRVACTQAGFVHNGTKRGRALTPDCIRPIMTETPQRKEATKALPEIDPQVVAACKKRNPNFGKGGRAKSQSTAQPIPTETVELE